MQIQKSNFPILEQSFNESIVSSTDCNNPVALKARRSAFNYFNEHGIPTNRQEKWKYCDLSGFLLNTFKLSIVPNKKPYIDFKHLIHGLESNRQFVFTNGILSEQYFPENFLVEILSSDAIPSLFYLNDSIHALNTAFYLGGFKLTIPKNVVISKPIYIVHICDPERENLMVHTKNIIIAEENSSATIVELQLCNNSIKSFTNAAAQITLEKKASLSHICLQKGSDNSLQIMNINVQQNEESYFCGTTIQTGGNVNRSTIHIDLNKSGAKCDFFTLEKARKEQNTDVYLEINHKVSECCSNTISRSVAEDRATASFTGKIIVKEDAIKTQAHLENKNLLLSPDAAVNSRPQLEIYNEDVKCSHGATVGHLELDALFYLRSRGISESKAKQLLIDGFIHPSLKNLPAEVMNYVKQYYLNS